MHVPPPKPSQKPEITIALINIVFLLLVFFIIAGTITSNENRDVEPAFTLLSDASETPDNAVFLDLEGNYRFRDQEIALGELRETLIAADVLPETGPTMLVPDRRLGAQDLIRALDDLNAAGLTHLSIVTVRGTGTE